MFLARPYASENHSSLFASATAWVLWVLWALRVLWALFVLLLWTCGAEKLCMSSCAAVKRDERRLGAYYNCRRSGCDAKLLTSSIDFFSLL